MVWSDPEVQKLAAAYVPAADASDRLQSPACHDADARLFQKFGGRRTIPSQRAGDGLGQGQYAVAPSGELLASAATADPREVAQMLKEGLARWEQLPRERRLLATSPSADAAKKWRRWDAFYPADGLVLRLTVRDLPRPDGKNDPGTPAVFRDRWNQDFAWFRKAEARSFLPAALVNGESCEVPKPLIERLVRLHLVDHVRALNYAFFKPEEVEVALLKTTVMEVREAGIAVRFEGATRASTPAPDSRGYESKLAGRAIWDPRKERFTSFELVAVGDRWGAGNCNQRNNDTARAPMGIALVMAGNQPADRICPAFISHYGWE